MINHLETILQHKKKEVALLYQLTVDRQHPITKILHGEYQGNSTANFKQALNKSSSIAIIAEIKRKSPSKGAIDPIIDPVKLAQTYIASGASALSILTDTRFFGGHVHDLALVTTNLHDQAIPVLRKDFIIDKIQIAEAAALNANAILCIVAVLGKKTKDFLDYARTLNIDVLVEVHNKIELSLALDCGAEIIGINNRDLKTFKVDTERASKLVTHIPHSIITVAESGISDPREVQQYHRQGFNAVLIGEALVKADDAKTFIQSCYE